MPYTVVPANINEAFSVSQPKITANFIAINTAISVDHETFDAAGQGKHKQVSMPIRGAGLDPITAANEMMLYTKNNALGVPAMFIKQQDIAAGTEGTDFTTATAAANGTCTLPCGIILKWGTGTALGGATGYLNTFVTPFTNNVFSVTITQIGAAANYDLVKVVTGTINITEFRATSYNTAGGATNYPIYYIAIGN